MEGMGRSSGPREPGPAPTAVRISSSVVVPHQLPWASMIVVAGVENPAEIPEHAGRLSVYPNPFNATTTVAFELARAELALLNRLARIIQEIEWVFRKEIATNELVLSYPEHRDLDGDLHSPMVGQWRATAPCQTMRSHLLSPRSYFVFFVLFVVHSDRLDVRVML